MLSLETVVLAGVGVALVALLSFVAKKASRSAAIPIDVVVGDDRTEVRASGRVLLSEPSVVRYTTNHTLGLPRLTNFAEKPDLPVDAKEYELRGGGEEPASGVVHAFIAGCCLRARRELQVSQMRPLRVQLTVGISDLAARSTFLREVHPKKFGAIGVELSLTSHPPPSDATTRS